VSRPRAASGTKRTAQMQVLVTDDEYDTFCRDALRARMTVSSYVREFLLKARSLGVSIVAKP
jgi:hypothetical protein